MSNTGHKHVTWVPREKAAYVRVAWKKRIHGAAWFYASEHGGKKRAIAAGVRHAARVCRKLGKPITDRVVNATARNTTGIVGMTIGRRQTDRRGRRFASEVRGTWVDQAGRLRRTSRSIKLHGLQEAKRQVDAILRQVQRERYGRALPRLRRQGGKR